MYVADRLIDAVCEIDYPRELLEIQVLDDSTDETRDIAELAVRRHAARGLRHQLPPPHGSHRLQGRRARGGPEGGARRVHRDLRRRLRPAARLPAADGAVLHATRRSAMVQARWGHLNQDYSLLTQDPGDPARRALRARARRPQPRRAASSISTARPASGAATAIDDAGGWQHDTLTEDLDLSYRAQLRGWQFVFLPDLVTPAEVPVEMNAFKSQQHRWARARSRPAASCCRTSCGRTCRSR